MSKQTINHDNRSKSSTIISDFSNYHFPFLIHFLVWHAHHKLFLFLHLLWKSIQNSDSSTQLFQGWIGICWNSTSVWIDTSFKNTFSVTHNTINTSPVGNLFFEYLRPRWAHLISVALKLMIRSHSSASDLRINSEVFQWRCLIELFVWYAC